jgi:multidrug efflux pump subunit AcrA (membrane-fusion protein)
MTVKDLSRYRFFWKRTAAILAAVSLLACKETGRVSEAAHADEEHSEPGRLTLTDAQFATAGIVVEAASMEPMIAEGAALDVPGQVEHDPRRVAIISSRTAGRIERVLFVEGERVGGGQTVALLSSPAFLTAQSDLAQARRRARTLAGTPDAEGANAQPPRRKLRRDQSHRAGS